jgi:hypothetical protein
MIQVIDNFLPIQWQESIKNMLLSGNFPWYYASDITYENDAINPAMYHVYRNDSKDNSAFFNLLSPMVHMSNLDVKDIVQARSFLQFPLANPRIIDKLHVDLEFNHTVLLYYVLDSDGDTIIVDKKFNNILETDLNFSDYNVLERVTPKQGRAVLFDGAYYHTAEQPRNNIRCIINFDLVLQDD